MSYTIPRRTVIQYLAGLSAGAAVGFGTRGLAYDTVRPTETKRAKGKSGIVSVTRGTADLVVPHDGEGFRYGTGFVFQAGPKQAGLLCNLRTEGYPVGDFEAGMDVLMFDDMVQISSAGAIPVTRTVKYADRITGQWRIVIKHGVKGGFVPLGARRADGSPHPHAGTGVGFCQALDFPMKGNGYYDKQDKTKGMVRTTEVQQLVFDGKKFEVPRFATYTEAKPLRTRGSQWKITSPSLRMGIPDGDDLLFAVTATSNDSSAWFSDPHAAGVSRWRRDEGLWQPVMFTPIVTSRMAKNPQVVYGRKMSVLPIEPTLVRDIDGSLLFTARFAYEKFDEHALRVWRSADGESWKLIIEQPDMKGQAPVTINRATDGTPYIVSNPLGRERDKLVLWSLNRERNGFEDPITARDALLQFGPPPSRIVWFMDHSNASVVRLKDGRWHNLLAYRIMDRGEHSGQPPAPQSGLYVEEVMSSGPEVPAWNFA
jgi:hypothetical protein